MKEVDEKEKNNKILSESLKKVAQKENITSK
jgi:hypothetical protein